MSTDNSDEIDIVPCHQGFIGIITIQDFSEQGPVQVIEKGSLIKMFERSKLYIYIYECVWGSHFGNLIDLEQEMGQWSLMLRSGTLTSVIVLAVCVYMVNKSGRRLSNSSR